jgi:hypothetical protein
MCAVAVYVLHFDHFCPRFVRGTHTPRMAHSARWGRRISFVLGLHAGAAAGFFCFCLHIPSG